MTKSKKNKIKYNIAYNGDIKLLEKLPKYKIVTGVFGKMKFDEVGGGRASYCLPEISWNELKDHIKFCHKNNINFNYLVNALCLGNREFIKSNHERILELLNKLSELDVDEVTVGTPYLCELVKKQYPHFKISVSTNLGIRTLQQIKYWEDLGADEITVDRLINRDFSMLRKILKYTKNKEIRIRLFANNQCLRDCPFRFHHGLTNSHASVTGEYTSDFFIDYHFLRCNIIKRMNPVKLIAGTWIRPDDIHYYEDLINEIDNEKLALKLVSRGSTTDYLLKLLEAYSRQSYNGNLLDIIYAAQKKYVINQKGKNLWDNFLNRISDEDYNLESIKKLKNALDISWLFIDNNKLNGFFEKFVKNNSCSDKICDDLGWKNKSDDDKRQKCSYCRNWAEKAITINEDGRSQSIEKLKSFVGDLINSNIFNLHLTKCTLKPNS